tara:strand:+ start:665 stop:1267 length:603 start_codon:yes stop_codon:yes gene_type:complete
MTLKLNGSSSGSVSIDAPATTTGGADLAYTLPNATTGGVIRTTTTPGAIIQVLQAFKDDTYTRTSDTTSTTITGLSQAITMTSASNKVLIMATIQVACGTSYGSHVLNLVRGSTLIAQPASAGNRTVGTIAVTPHANGTYPNAHAINYLDTPGAGTHTYAVQDMDGSGNNAIYINRTTDDTDNSGYSRLTSSLILMEVAA